MKELKFFNSYSLNLKKFVNLDNSMGLSRIWFKFQQTSHLRMLLQITVYHFNENEKISGSV